MTDAMEIPVGQLRSTRRLLMATPLIVSSLCFAQTRPAQIDRFNYVVGTQTIGARYQFSDQSRLAETAGAILEMGSNTIKFSMSRSYAGAHGNVPRADPRVKTLCDLAAIESSHKRVLDMPFAYYLIWASPFEGGGWRGGLGKSAAQREYAEMHEFARHLLRTYSGSGKVFLLGHWEGDWLLHGNYDPKSDIPDVAVRGMIDWLNIRQKAIDDAKKDTPHHDAQVFGYTEANLVQIAMKGARSVTNDVLPKTNVDFVSYSSYDSLSGDIGANLKAALDYIESKLPPKKDVGIGGKRVFIGEYGFPAINCGAQKQDELSRQVMKAALEWGCPFVLYWEMYCNEIEKDRHRGFWMIDDKGVRQPIYLTHQRLYSRARTFVSDFRKASGRQPTPEEYRRFAAALLSQ